MTPMVSRTSSGAYLLPIGRMTQGNGMGMGTELLYYCLVVLLSCCIISLLVYRWLGIVIVIIIVIIIIVFFASRLGYLT